ncbi:MAG TPA: aldehyde dehydrogenase family protein [Gemmataceae bacterium]|nr:aldehyde dehydrogenase family protein [Gemmataceae bacterium]
MSPTSILSGGIPEAVERCRQQQPAWAALPVSRRLRPVRALRRLLVDNGERLAEAVARDMGKPAEEALAGEVLPLADALRFLERRAEQLLRPRRVPIRERPLWLWGQRDTVHRRPRGVVAIIGTWNYPIYLNGVQLAQALTAGNGVVWKPSEVAPASAAALFALLEQAGFPAGLVQLLPATRQAGQELLEADIDHVVFTGSAATGRVIAETLGRRLVSSTLELSGCDALFVLDDADVALAARSAWFGATVNRGQTCIAVRRALVHRSIYAPFTEILRSLAAKAAPVPLVLPAQVKQAERLVRDAAAGGARLLTAPSANNVSPDHCVPAVVLDARPEMAVWQEASFAPLLAVMPFDTLEEALASETRCPYGLGAAIFTQSPARAAELAGRLRTGMVTINDVVVPTAHPAVPFGGRAQSGWGVTQGAEGLLEMTVPQVVSVRRGRFRPHLDLAGSLGGRQVELARALLEFSHGATLGRRCRGLLQLLRAAFRRGE